MGVRFVYEGGAGRVKGADEGFPFQYVHSFYRKETPFLENRSLDNDFPNWGSSLLSLFNKLGINEAEYGIVPSETTREYGPMGGWIFSFKTAKDYLKFVTAVAGEDGPWTDTVIWPDSKYNSQEARQTKSQLLQEFFAAQDRIHEQISGIEKGASHPSASNLELA